MGKILTIGADEVSAHIEALLRNHRDKAKEMIQTAGDMLVDRVRAKIVQFNAIDTRTLYNSIGTTNLKVGDDKISIDVTAKGSRQRGRRSERNARIGFVVNYGHGRAKPKPIFTDAADEAAPEIQAKWKEMMSSDD